MKQMTLDVVSKGIQFLSILSFNKITIQWVSNMLKKRTIVDLYYVYIYLDIFENIYFFKIL
jgi:hypothetical protein